ncbi:MAG: GIY-YIG nuclease family protein [Bacteroidota bacterium]|nr:MAG: GIY-YIG nuclease family protein [Bacteroidota bacterium]
MAYKVYILFSPTQNKLYVGYTSSLSQRLESHN